MAKLIFTREGSLYRIAQDQDFIDSNKNFNEIDYDILNITIEEFNDFKNGVKKIVSHNGSTVTFDTINYSLDQDPETGLTPKPVYETESQLKEDIEKKINLFKDYLIPINL